ncbi:MAG: serine hydrolase domain-containing protein, partial [Longimicrobiales bacterium]|nr:serine hydrolase domain-containing protein [Longimicrobiales bacterium]
MTRSRPVRWMGIPGGRMEWALLRSSFPRPLLLLLLLVGGLLVGPSPVRSQAGTSFPTDDELTALLQERVEQGRAVGIVLGVRGADGSTRVVTAGKAGDSARPLDEESVFEIGSVTKVFTGILLADMARRDEVSLSDPVARHLPDDVRVPSRNGREITLFDLATHHSALPRLPSNLDPRDPANPYADYTVEEMYDFLSGWELGREIGSEYEYSNLGVGLLGHALSRAAGASYEALVRERILEPLGMGNTAITLSEEMRARLARGHDLAGEPASLWDLPTLAGAG